MILRPLGTGAGASVPDAEADRAAWPQPTRPRRTAARARPGGRMGRFGRPLGQAPGRRSGRRAGRRRRRGGGQGRRGARRARGPGRGSPATVPEHHDRQRHGRQSGGQPRHRPEPVPEAYARGRPAWPRRPARTGVCTRVSSDSANSAPGSGRVGHEQQRQSPPARHAGERRARPPAWRRSRPARLRSRDRSGRRQLVASQAFLSFCIVRCSIVPAFDSLTPEHPGELGIRQPGVELQRDDLPLARRQRSERLAHGRPAQRDVGVVGRPAARSRRRARSRAWPAAGGGAAHRAPRCGRSRTATPVPRPAGDRTSAGAGTRARTPAP